MKEEEIIIVTHKTETINVPELMMKKKTIYFAHSHQWMDSKRKWKIKQILESRGYKVIDPFEHEQDIIDKYGYVYNENRTKPYAEDITEKDYDLVKNADELFAWFPIGSTTIGTPLEVCWAKNMGKKVTVLYSSAHPFLWSERIAIYKLYISYQDFKDDKPLFVRE